MSPQRREWKEQLAAALGSHPCAELEGPLAVDVEFELSAKRNWVTVWKPTIDALGGTLGHSALHGARWAPRDDRIRLLVLRRVVDESRGWAVGLRIGWRELG